VRPGTMGANIVWDLGEGGQSLTLIILNKLKTKYRNCLGGLWKFFGGD